MAAVAALARKKRVTRRDSESTPTILPVFRQPQKAILRERLPVGDDWLFEVKFDGYRCQVSIAGDDVHLYSSSGADWTNDKFAALAPAFRGLTRGSLLLDGEVCALDERGRPNFSLLKHTLDGRSPLVFFAFDLLSQDGEDLSGLPLLERKQRLEVALASLPEGSPVRYSWHVCGDGAAMLKAMQTNGMEGVVAKRIDARYISGNRSEGWLKVKVKQRQEFVIVGWRRPDYGPNDLRSLFLATYEDGQLVYRGGVGTGFNERARRELLADLRSIHTGRRLPIKGMPPKDVRAVQWVEPVRLAEVEFAEITPDGLVRHSSFKGVRYDKAATDVHLERAR